MAVKKKAKKEKEFDEKVREEVKKTGIPSKQIKEILKVRPLEHDAELTTRDVSGPGYRSGGEQKAKPENLEIKDIEEKKICPFNSALACKSCRLFQSFSNQIEKMCVLVFTAMRNV